MYQLNRFTNKDTIAYFNCIASSWDDRSVIDGEKIACVLNIAEVPCEARVLDVACGTGALFPYLLEYTPKELIGIDISTAMVDIARRKYNHPHLSVLVNDFYEFVDSDFDLITLYNAYPHFSDRKRFVEQACRLLRPGGRMLIFHGNGRRCINDCHSKNHQVSHISTCLKSCLEESHYFEESFEVDIMLDMEHLYVLSGKKQS